MRITLALPVCLLLLAVRFDASAQDSIQQQLSPQYLDKVAARTSQLEIKLDKKSAKAIAQMQRTEAKMKKKLARIDSIKAKEIFTGAEQRYQALQQRIEKGLPLRQHIPSLDTLFCSAKFLQQNPQLLSRAKDINGKLKETISKVNGLNDEFQKAEEIKNFLKERKQFLKEQLGKLGFAKQLKKLNKQAYYYNQQVQEYKELLKDQAKIERKAIELLSRTKLFRDFMNKNSFLASIFPSSANAGSQPAQTGFAALQTRAQVNSLIRQTGMLSAGMSSPLQKNIQDAQSQLNDLRSKIGQLSGGNVNSDELPGFKPNSQKTKSFFRRLEYGTSFQTQKASGLFPATSDVALSAGYKLNDKSIIGIGVSYKMGLGRGWNNIRFSNQGAGLRSFIDWKLKGSFWISGGYEQNYRTLFTKLDELKDFNAWQQSGLLGLSKIVSLKTKFFRKTKLQLLWDFLSYQEKPRTQPLIFRIGYNF